MSEDLDSEAPAPTSPAMDECPSPEYLDPMQFLESLNAASKKSAPKGAGTVGQEKTTLSLTSSSSSGGSSNSMEPVVSDSSSEDQKDRVSRRALTDVDTILRDRVPAQIVESSWDEGLSPEPLYSFQHGETKCRHWALSENPGKFICSTERGEKHHRGGNAHMDILKRICTKCLHKVSVNPGVQFRQYVANQVKSNRGVS